MIGAFAPTNAALMNATVYKGSIDGNWAALARAAAVFAPAAQETPSMKVLVDPGAIWNPNKSTLTQIGGLINGDITSGSATVANVSSTSGLAVGQVVRGHGIPANTTIATIGSGSITLSANATATATGVALICSQLSALITAPTLNPRIDRVVVDAITGLISIVTGVQGASPVPPAIPAGKLPVAQILLTTSTTAISNTMMMDERSMGQPASNAAGFVPGPIASVASATTTDLGAAGANVINLTGTATVTSFGTSALASSPIYDVYVSGTPLLTHGASLSCPGGKNIQCQAGDFFKVLDLGSGTWVILDYVPAGGQSLADRGVKTLASAATTNIGAEPNTTISLTLSAAAITSFGSSGALGVVKKLLLPAGITITNNANIINIGGADIITQAGDSCELIQLSSGIWTMITYTRQSGQALTTVSFMSLPVSVKVADYAMVLADRGSEINYTASGFTFTLLSAAAAGNGGMVFVRNSAASGDITLTVSGGGTVDGLTSRLMRPGDIVGLRSDGSVWRAFLGRYSFRSAGQAIVLNTVSSVAHGLGEIPNFLRWTSRCKIANNGWSVGDEIDLLSTAITYEQALSADINNIYFNQYRIYYHAASARGSVGSFYMDNTNWEYILYAECRKS